MNTQITQIIKEFALAHRAAEDNPKLLIEDSVKHTDLCVARMDRIEVADEALFALEGQAELPQPVLDFFAAEADRGCYHCWLSSRHSNQHPECQAKINRWFATRDALIVYGEQL